MDFDFDMNKDFVFTSDKDGVLRGGGFTIHSELLKDAIYDYEPNSDVQSGGKKNNSRELSNTFKDLAVPAGLFSMPNNPTQVTNKNIRYHNTEEVLEDGLYDKLLGMLEPSKRKLHGMKTRRKRENSGKNKSRKSK